MLDSDNVLHINVPHLSVWFAIPDQAGGGGREYRASIRTPEGDVTVFPHEYRLFDIEPFLAFTEEDGLRIHFLSSTGGLDEPAMFYIRSRGISKADAQRMLLPTLKDQNFCYFTFSDAIREIFPEGTGTPYIMDHNRERRAAARIKKGQSQR